MRMIINQVQEAQRLKIMTTKRVTQRRTKLEKNKPEVISMLVHGSNESQVAARYHVDPSAVTRFVQRHAVEIQGITEVIEANARENLIADKTWRITESQRQYTAVDEWLQEHGLSQRSVRYDKDGNEVGETISLRKDALDALRSYRREVAEELGALPRPDQNINVKAMMLIREIGGTEIDVS